MLKQILDIACKVGLHHGDWVYRSDGQCMRTRICRNCRARTRRVKHKVRKWHTDGFFSTEEHGICERCSKTQTRDRSNDMNQS